MRSTSMLTGPTLPTHQRKSAREYRCGNGSSGTSAPSSSLSGSQPSLTDHSTRRLGGHNARNDSLCPSNAAIA